MLFDKSHIALFAFEITFVMLREIITGRHPQKKVVYFQALPDLARPNSGNLVLFFLDFKTTFCAHDRKNTDDYNDDCNDNYDSNDGNLMIMMTKMTKQNIKIL